VCDWEDETWIFGPGSNLVWTEILCFFIIFVQVEYEGDYGCMIMVRSYSDARGVDENEYGMGLCPSISSWFKGESVGGLWTMVMEKMKKKSLMLGKAMSLCLKMKVERDGGTG